MGYTCLNVSIWVLCVTWYYKSIHKKVFTCSVWPDLIDDAWMADSGIE